MHHCIADGQGAVRSLLSLTKPRDGESSSKPLQHAQTNKTTSSIWKIFLLPITLLFFILGLFLIAWKNLLVTLFSKKVFVTTTPILQKRAAWTQVSLNEVKTMKTHFKCTVNDILVAILTGAYHNYLSKKHLLLQTDLLTAIPVSMRKPDDWTLNNQSTTVILWLPIGLQNPLDRLKEVQKRMTTLKNSSESRVNFIGLKMCGFMFMFSFIHTFLVGVFKWFLNKYQAIMTNVPGPAIPLNFASRSLDSYIAIIPQPGQGGLGVAMLSYCDKVSVSILTDAQLESSEPPVSNQIVHEFQLEFDRFLQLATSSKKQN